MNTQYNPKNEAERIIQKIIKAASWTVQLEDGDVNSWVKDISNAIKQMAHECTVLTCLGCSQGLDVLSEKHGVKFHVGVKKKDGGSYVEPCYAAAIHKHFLEK